MSGAGARGKSRIEEKLGNPWPEITFWPQNGNYYTRVLSPKVLLNLGPSALNGLRSSPTYTKESQNLRLLSQSTAQPGMRIAQTFQPLGKSPLTPHNSDTSRVKH